MKYYRKIIKSKEYYVLIIGTILMLLGFFTCYISISYLLHGIIRNGLSTFTIINNGLVGIIGLTNIGLAIISIFLIYFGFMIPIIHPSSQYPEEYEIKSSGKNLFIKFRNYEFIVKKEAFSPTDFIFKDKNGKFVSLMKAYQIYNYILFYHKKALEAQIDKENLISDKNISIEFHGIRPAEKDEIQKLILSENLKKVRPFFKFFSIMFWLMGILLCFSIFSSEYSIGFKLFFIPFGISFCYLGKTMWQVSTEDNILLTKINNGKVYVSKCYSFDKRNYTENHRNSRLIHCYEIKVYDKNNHYIDRWFKIDSKTYKSCEQVEANLFLIIYKKETIIKVKTDAQLKK